MKKIKPIHIYLIFNILGVLSFVVLNRITNGYFFEQDFFQLTEDAIYDFFVFLNQNSTSAVAFTTGSNPPLIRLIFRFIFKSLPIDIQEKHPEVQLWPDPADDLRVNAYAFLCFWLMFTLAIILMAKLCEENLQGTKLQKNIFIVLSLFSTGIIWAVERGNIVILAMVCTMYFCFNYESEDKKKEQISYLLLGIAISIKIYPAVFCLLLLKDKNYKAIIKTIVYVILFTIIPLAISGGIPTILAYIGSLFNQVSSSSNLRAGYLNGLSILLTLCRVLGIEDFYLEHLVFFRIFNYVFCIVICFASVYLTEKKWVKITTLIFAMYLLPGITHTYMLSFILIPLIMFLNEETKITAQNIIATIGFLMLTTIIPLKNSSIVVMLRDQTVVNVANRLSAIMLMHVIGEIVLTCIVFIELIKGVIHLASKKQLREIKCSDQEEGTIED